MKIVECVPNFSEGRDESVLAQIAACFDAENVVLLHRTADVDHNRSVLTAAGEANAVAAAVVRAVGIAARTIDMRAHVGAHPCIGAADVVPFVPLSGIDMAETVRMAGAVAEGIATGYEIPTYLYEEAATRPQYRNLAAVRKGGFAVLGQRMTTLDGLPDFGPMRPHPTAGATAVGARKFLVAFNVNLASRDVGAARRIAARIRERDGGLPKVKALGLYLDAKDRVQVSMNLVDYEITSPIAAFREVARLAAEEGLKITESELIGLIPAAAAIGLDAAEVALTCDVRERILESRLPPQWGGAATSK